MNSTTPNPKLARQLEQQDMLVRLYDLPSADKFAAPLAAHGITVRRARSYEMSQVLEWIEQSSSRGWMDECRVAFARAPVSCFIATHEGHIVGFGAYEATYRNFVGPLGVAPAHRGKQVAQGILCAMLHAMASEGYAYAIMGSIKELSAMLLRTFKAMPIPQSSRSIYTDRLKNSDS